MTQASRTEQDLSWRGMIRVGAAGAMLVLLLIPAQAAVFLLNPPPATAAEFFRLFQENPWLGLLSLDLLLTLDYLALVPFYLALYAVIRAASGAWALLGLILGLGSVLLFIVSREATFSMWMLSSQFADAASDQERGLLLAAGTGMLTLYNGGTFAISYLLGAAGTLVYSVTMLRHRIYGRLPAAVGILTGATMLVPANAGSAGLILAMLSLIPTALWLILLIPQLLGTARDAGRSRTRG
ncbi:DUF4386 family protein [Arthrobacter gandavensis]|uniref:DUF4386 family protein n=1 Tax=Arthrobacter gandavensis TaxID=169960 RepID=UPI00188F1A59|nr:DUF4386 family protein [Arthrobacter gandavensis]MBF4992579.1 DUF4386 family protein [Arthrobacter gandavensis]